MRSKVKVVAIVLGIVLIVFLGVALAAQVKCPIDQSAAYFTGNTKVDVSGKLLYEYKCTLWQHTFWTLRK